MQRRSFLAASTLPLWACSGAPEISGGFIGINHVRGHLLKDAKSGGMGVPARERRTRVLVLGAGVAGLAAARSLLHGGEDDFAVLELEDEAGGNSRGRMVGGIACPQGAHYLPLPGDDASEVQDLLEELGLRRRVAGRWEYDERHLCHSPQERLLFNGEWQEGLLPVQGVGADTIEQYRTFSRLVEQAQKASRWSIPVSKSGIPLVQQALCAITFVAYLDQHLLTDAHLRWYLDYCCRDDYGAGIGSVSAWAGLHYFASRHGFHAPGMQTGEREGLLTWPEGNAWLTRRMAAPLGERIHSGQVVLRVANAKHGVEVDVFNTAAQQVERWHARRAVVALPRLVAARVVQDAPDFLREAAAATVYAPWLVANIHIKAPLFDRPGAAPAWDNVLYGTAGLGYVDAMHQSLHPVPGATVLTHYRALGDGQQRQLLLDRPWEHWRDEILDELSLAHPDLPQKATRIDITRYGHAMATPAPQNKSQIGHKPLWNKRIALSKKERYRLRHGSLTFAHSDWVGYSVFEEAFTLGHAAGEASVW